MTGAKETEIEYIRSNGKKSNQVYNLSPLSKSNLIEAGEISQATKSQLLIEMRFLQGKEIAHWEFDNYKSFISSHSGLVNEEPENSIYGWAKRISLRTGMNEDYVKLCIEAFEKNKDQI